MRRVFVAIFLISLVAAFGLPTLRAQSDNGPVLLQQPVAVPAESEKRTRDQFNAIEKRIEELERRHHDELDRVYQRVHDLERQLQAVGAPPEGPPQPPAEKKPQEQVESAVEQMLRQAEQEPTPRPAGGLSVLNPNITLIGDFLGRVSSLPEKSDGRGIQLEDFESGDIDGFLIREISLEARAAIDPFADAVVKLSHAEVGVEIEEAYALFHSFPESCLSAWLEGWHAKVGIFRMNFGAVNLVDGHDLPTVDRPVALQNFVTGEGLIRAGISLSRSFELPCNTFGEWTVELVNGEGRGDELDPLPFTGRDNPLVLTHFKTFREYENPCECDPTRWWNPWVRCVGKSDLQLGATAAYTARFDTATDDDLFSFVEGLDFTWKGYDARPDSYRSYLLQAELIASEIELEPDSVRTGVGAYVLGQVRLNRNWFVGLRGDGVRFPDASGHQFAVTPFATYFFSEFNRIRLQYQFLTQVAEDGVRDDIGTADGHTVWVQWVWAIGAHPPEPYYVSPRF